MGSPVSNDSNAASTSALDSIASAIALRVWDRLRADSPTQGSSNARDDRGNSSVDVCRAATGQRAVLLVPDWLRDGDGGQVNAVDVLSVDVVTNRRRQQA